MGEVTVITSGKGGTGKSTVTAGLGAALVRRGGRILLIDCDAGMRGIDLSRARSRLVIFPALKSIIPTMFLIIEKNLFLHNHYRTSVL